MSYPPSMKPPGGSYPPPGQPGQPGQPPQPGYPQQPGYPPPPHGGPYGSGGGGGQPPYHAPPPKEGKGNTLTIVLVVVVVLLLLLSCGMCCACPGLYGLAGAIVPLYSGSNDWNDSGWYDSGVTTGTYSEWSWGQLKVTSTSASIYSTNSTGGTVAETKASGDVFDYYGFDDSLAFYKIKTAAGTDGYIQTTDVELYYGDSYADTTGSEWKWGEVKVTSSSTQVYTNNDSGSTVLETLSRGDKIDYYGFDDSFNYYRVKTSGGSDGYVKLLEAEITY
ncbi:MAG: hypothetical protein QGH45_17785 [Myxococcota bacterium]|nr:hypothetical protein [Myxococcota bacterium]